jgi:hypothetical protein
VNNKHAKLQAVIDGRTYDTAILREALNWTADIYERSSIKRYLNGGNNHADRLTLATMLVRLTNTN